MIIDRSYHNLFNQILNKFTGNDLHAYMDRFAKQMRHNHRQAGHDYRTLAEMMFLFRHKYNPMQILKTWLLHRAIDNWDGRFKQSVRNNNPRYGKKDNLLETIEKLKRQRYG